MSVLGGIGIDVASFLGLATVLVLVHELGHYLAARGSGIRVEVFAIGFGPELFGWSDRAGTRWKFCVLPLGGYIRMYEGDPTDLSPHSAHTSRETPFDRQPLGARAAIAAAGPAANLTFGMVIFAVMLTIMARPGSAIGPLSLLWEAINITAQLSSATAHGLWQVLTGARSAQQLMGPLGAVQVAGAAAEKGFPIFVLMTAVFSVNLGVTNLLPIPGLDGGHLLYYLAEALCGRPLGAQAQTFGIRAGLALVLALMVFVTWNDLVHLGVVASAVRLLG